MIPVLCQIRTLCGSHTYYSPINAWVYESKPAVDE